MSRNYAVYSGDFPPCYCIKETQQGFLRGFIPGPLRLLGFTLSYGLGIKYLGALLRLVIHNV